MTYNNFGKDLDAAYDVILKEAWINNNNFDIPIPRNSEGVKLISSDDLPSISIPRMSFRDENGLIVNKSFFLMTSSSENESDLTIDEYSGEFIEINSNFFLQFNYKESARPAILRVELNNFGDCFRRYSGFRVTSMNGSHHDEIFSFDLRFQIMKNIVNYFIGKHFVGSFQKDFSNFLVSLSSNKDLSSDEMGYMRDFVNKVSISQPELFNSSYIRDLCSSRGLVINSHGLVRPFSAFDSMELLQIRDNYVTLLSIITQIGANCCGGFGTLLGFFRDKGFIPWDDDIDILVWDWNTHSKDLIHEKLQHAGFTFVEELSVHGVCQLKFSGAFDVQFDIFFGSDINREDSIDFGIGPPIKRDLLLEQQLVPILGKLTPILSESKKYLDVVYGGNWLEPEKNFIHLRK